MSAVKRWYERVNEGDSIFKKASALECEANELRAELDELSKQLKIDELHQLMNFYGVRTLVALVEAQEYHIQRLQEKLPKSLSLAPQHVREG